MINDGLHRGFGLLGGRTCNTGRLGGKKTGKTHCPCKSPGINKRDGLSAERLQIMFVIFAKSGLRPVFILSTIYNKLLISLFNKVNFFICLTRHPLPTFSISLSPSLSLCEVNAAAQPQPTSPALFTVGVSTERFKICPFIWAAQAGKWKGYQSLEPWESAWLKRRCQNRGEGTKRANTVHTVIDFFCQWAMSERR